MSSSPTGRVALDKGLGLIDPEVAAAIDDELARHRSTLEPIASENFAPLAVLQAQGSVLTNKYADGYPGRRYYGGCAHVDVPDHVVFHRMFPMSADRTNVECDWLYAKDVVADGRDLGRSVELFHRVNQQDFDACERCQPAMGSRTYAIGGVPVPSEHHIGEFHEWVQGALTTNEGR